MSASIAALALLGLPFAAQELPRGVRVPAARVPASEVERARPVPRSLALADAFEPGFDHVSLGDPRPEEIPSEAAEDCGTCIRPTERMGFTRAPSAEQSAALGESWRPHVLADGDVVWTTTLRSPGAAGVRLQFEGVDLGEQELLAWTPYRDGTVARGPWSGAGPRGTGRFWTSTLPGDTVRLEVRGGERPRLRVRSLAHLERLPGGAAHEDVGNFIPASGNAHPCTADVACQNFGAGLQVARDASASILYVDDDTAMVRACSGTALNDLDDSTIMPFFLTAYHCVSSATEAASLEVVWNWQLPSCGGAVPDWNLLDHSCGATILANDPETGGSDMSLLLLDDPLPPGTGLAGFADDDAPSSNLYSFSHPRGDVKKYAALQEAYLAICPLAYNAFNYDYFEASLGMTEPGSSGSAIFDSSGRVFGQLSGKCCEPELGLECEDASCGNDSDWRSAYGESAVGWEEGLGWWLVRGGLTFVAPGSGFQDGSQFFPWHTVAAGASAVFPGGRLLVEPAVYPETVVFTQPDTTVEANGTGSVVIGD